MMLLPVAHAQLVQDSDKLSGPESTQYVGGFGYAVALSADGSTAIVGGGERSGGAWVLIRSGGVWSQQGGKLVGSGSVGDWSGGGQGSSVAISADGSTVIVGAPLDDLDGTTGNAVGAAWVFTRSGGVWSQQGPKLVGTGVDRYWRSYQGVSVALSADGNTAIVGGPLDESGYYGAAWIFRRTNGVWAQQGKKLVGAGGTQLYQGQGQSVALSADGTTAIVGGPGDGAWVYVQDGGVWIQQGMPLVGTGSAGNAYQGHSVSLSADGNTAIVGGALDNKPSSNQNAVGAAWVFTRSGGVWTQQGNKLVGAGSVGGADQGWSVALSGDGNTAIVGGPYDSPVGAAWVFTRSGGVWTQQGNKLVGTGVSTYLGEVNSAAMGYSVALSADGKTAMLGGPSDLFNGSVWTFGTPSGPFIAAGGVVNGASFQPGIGPGSWVTIPGANLASSTRTWTNEDFSGNELPTQLDGVSVTVNGKPAYIYYISPTQLNVLAPAETTQGAVPVQVTTSHVKSNIVNAVEATVAPAVFTFSQQGGKYIAAVRADGTYIAPLNLITGVTTALARPGDILLLYGTGFGATTPPSPIGQLINPAPLADRVTVTIGGMTAQLQFAGLVGPGLYQFNVVVPAVGGGDKAISISVGSSSSQRDVFLPIQQ